MRQFAFCILHFAFCIPVLAARPELPNTPQLPEAERACYSRGHAGHFVAWVQGRLTPATATSANTPRLDSFLVDRDQPRELRWSPSDYDGAGYDTGHLWPASYARDAASERDTFLITNTMPQAPGLNRGQWARLEAYILRRVAAGETADVIAGPAFLPSPKSKVQSPKSITIHAIGRNGLWVPTHCWKAAAFSRGEKPPHDARAWLIPNRAVEDYGKYSLSIDELEAAVGLDLFPGLDAELED